MAMKCALFFKIMGLCCFDGCHNRCLNGPKKTYATTTTTTSTQAPPPPPSPYPIRVEAAKATTERGFPLSSINQREQPTLVLHIFGPPKSKALVQFGNLPPSLPAAERRLGRKRGGGTTKLSFIQGQIPQRVSSFFPMYSKQKWRRLRR